jgi:preprotein translocase subunit SecB
MTEENQNTAATENEQQAAPQFAIQRIYLKDASFETPSVDPALKAEKPQISQDLNVEVNPVNEELIEVVLLITITAKSENRTVFLVEIKQAGLFRVAGFEPQQVAQIINTTCPQILFPYARETVDSLLNRGGFPPLMMPPINFDAVFVQAMEAMRQQQAEAAAKTDAAAEAAPN